MFKFVAFFAQYTACVSIKDSYQTNDRNFVTTSQNACLAWDFTDHSVKSAAYLLDSEPDRCQIVNQVIIFFMVWHYLWVCWLCRCLLTSSAPR